MRKKGFTLVELLVVICIIAIIASVSVGLVNIFFRGQGARQGAAIVSQALAQTKQLAANRRSMCFAVFLNRPDGGEMQIYVDTGSGTAAPDKTYTPGTDVQIATRAYLLPKNVRFLAGKTPFFIAIGPSGYCEFSTGQGVGTSAASGGGGGFSPVQASNFEGSLSANNVDGDIVIVQSNDKYHMCMDVDTASGKVRRSHFLVK